MDLGLTDKVALVCASSKGLGRAIATTLAHEGARVAICARTVEELDSARNEIAAQTGSDILAVATDLTNLSSITGLVERTVGELGPIEILVTNAGGPPPGPFETHDAAAWQAAYDLNLRSVVELCRLVAPAMKTATWGRILNVTSVAVKQPVDNLILSNSLRAAVTGFARTLANELAPHGVTVNNLMPGYTRTARLDGLAAATASRDKISVEQVYAGWNRQIPMGRLGEPEEFAAAAAFLASVHASYITGSSIAVDGGLIRALI